MPLHLLQRPISAVKLILQDPRHSAEKSNDQVREYSYTFFSTYGTQSQERSPSLSQTLVLNQIVLCTELSLISALERYVFHYECQSVATQGTLLFLCLSEMIPSHPSCFRQFLMFT